MAQQTYSGVTVRKAVYRMRTLIVYFDKRGYGYSWYGQR